MYLHRKVAPVHPSQQLPLRNCSVDQARAHIRDRTTPLGCERVPLARALGRVSAEAPKARHNLPSHPVSVMDGYAICAVDVQSSTSPEVALQLVGESSAGHPYAGAALQPGQACRISTGAVMPPGADAVIAQEDTRRDGQNVVIVRQACGPVSPGKFVRAAGSDLAKGQQLIAAGSHLNPGELALLAAGGHTQVSVYHQPRVAIICSGDELIEPGQAPEPGQVVSTNGAMLAELVREAGGVPVDFGRIRDDPAALQDCLQQARCCDLILTSGGISVGDHDHTLACLSDLGFVCEVRKLRLRPGRPTTYGRLGETHVLALPGNPASTYVAFELFGRPAILHLQGSHTGERIRVRVPLATALKPAGNRDHYMRGIIQNGCVAPLPTQVSGALRSLVGHNALIVQPAGAPAQQPGNLVEVMLLPPSSPATEQWA